MRNIRNWKTPAVVGAALGLGVIMLVATPAAAAVSGDGTVSVECGGMPYNGGPCG